MSRSLRYRHPEIRAHLASHYVLGTLSESVRRRFERLIREDPQLEADVYHWQQKMNPINDNTPAVQPPARVWKDLQRMMKTSSAPRQADPGLLQRLWHLLPLWRSTSALLLIFSLALLLIPADQTVQPVNYMAIMQSHPAQPEAPMIISAYKGGAPGESHLHVQWNDRMTSSDLNGLTLWTRNRKDGSLMSLGPLQRASGTRLLSKPEWLAVKDSSELLAIRGQEPDGEIVYRGPCLQLSPWQTDRG